MRTFPAGFLWGTANAAYQVEGRNQNADWWDFEHVPGRIQGGDSSEIACDHYHRYREDFELLRELNQNAHRLSIEWSRIEPSEGVFDADEISHYRDVLQDLRDRGLTPMVTLHHFTSPRWFAARGGWEARGAPGPFLGFVRRVADELGELIPLWCTINEPTIYATNGWLAGEFPPGRKADLIAMYRVTANLRRAHEAAYVEIKRRWPSSQVGLSQHKFLLIPQGPRLADRWAARIAQSVLDRWPVGYGRRRRVVEATADYVGIAHYWGQWVAFDPRLPGEQFIRRFNAPGVPVTDMGWSANPAWMRRVLNELRPLGKPVYITENGLATADDALRTAYLQSILANVWLAVQDGVDVRGYFHWTDLDNFEWARGYAPKFGLIAVDRGTLQRTIKPSGRRYAQIAGANALA